MQHFNYHKALWYPLHAMFIVGLIFTDYTWFYALLAFCGWILLAGLGSAVGLHRMLSHRAVTPGPILRNFISYLGTMCCQGSTLFWVALHRGYHHRASDTPRDIHSPIKGKWSSYFGWTYTIKSDSVNLKYAVDLTREPFQMFLHKNYYYIIWGTWIAIAVIFGWKILLWAVLVPTVIAMHTDYLTNLFGHVPAAGYRNYDRPDLSTNVPWLALITWGQCWHNNHHEQPLKYDFGTGVSGKWWEFDPCRIFLFLFKR
jgi:fatty-acid desaturase